MASNPKRFTDKEALFVRHLAATGDPVYAATRAGYAQPPSAAHKAMARPDIVRAAAETAEYRLATELVPLALDTLAIVMTSDKAPYNAKVAAAKATLDAAKSRAASAAARDVHEMSAAELEAERSRLLGELSARATVILEADAVATADAVAAGGIFD